MRFRRFVQTLSFLLFFGLLMAATLAAVAPDGLDIYLRLDPALMLLTGLGARTLTWAYVPVVVVVLTGLAAGRFFCGFICPLGATLDGANRLFCPGKKKTKGKPGARRIKYLVLVFLIGAALLGAGWVHWASPLSLVTRFYGLVVHPVLAFLADHLVTAARPLAESLNLYSLMFIQINPPLFAAGLFVLGFFIVLFGLNRIAPRFWCRYICPAGAILALTSSKPVIRRQVSSDCTQCGLCAGKCPMGAIPADKPDATLFSECIICQTCVGICPVKAIRFDFSGEHIPADPGPGAVTRRQVLTAGAAGVSTALVGLTGLTGPFNKNNEGLVTPAGLVRPPGARPEKDFLARCVRCGECMTACPTNTLQPIWLEAGLPGIFSPGLTPRRGFCDPKCSRCGLVCPTDAIRNLSGEERLWAKTGTASVLRHRCLAWEHQKSCMVCDEVCPFDAIEFRREPGNPYPVPHVIEDRCAGCGYCEHFCPIRNQAAIVISPAGEIRLSQGSYREQGLFRGLKLSLADKKKTGYPSEKQPASPYGEVLDDQISDDRKSDGQALGDPARKDLAPGFTE